MFNVRIKRFFDTEQVQIFSHGMFSNGEVDSRRVDRFTGEILPRRKCGHLEEVPFFDADYTRVYDFPDPEKSLYKSFLRTKKTIYDIARANCWDWFLTFTFDGKKVNRYDYDECVKKFSVWLSNAKRSCPDMVYIVVPEQHKDGAFHFHGLFAKACGLGFHFSGRYDGQKRPIFNVGKYNFGFTTATRISDTHRASSYLCKYVTKDLCAVSRNRKRYWVSRNAKRPEVWEAFIPEEEEERFRKFYADAFHMKSIETSYVNVKYLEKSIYATNPCFSHRSKKNPQTFCRHYFLSPLFPLRRIVS